MTHKNIVLFASALLLAACNPPTTPSTLGNSPAPIVAPTSTGTATLKVFIPTLSATGIHTQYLPATTSGLRVRLGTFDQTFPVGGTQQGCAAVTGGVSCTFTLTVAAGAQTLRLDALDSSNHVLSTASQAVTVVRGQNNPFDVTLTGVAAAGAGSLTPTSRASEVTASSGAAILDRGGAFSFAVALRDASGQLIVDPGLPSFVVCSSNPAFVVSAATTPLPVVTAPEPTGTAQTATLFLPADGNCATTVGPLASSTLTVPAFHLTLSVPPSMVAGSSAVTTAQLRTALNNPLTVAGRSVAFSTTAGSMSAASVLSDGSGQASVNLIAPSSLTSGTVTASSAGVSANANFTTVAGTPNATTSVVTVSPASVRVGAGSTVTVTLKDGNGNPVMTTPTLSGTNGVSIGAASASGNVFTFAVTAPATPSTVVFSASVGGNVVGTANLAVTAYPLSVLDGASAVGAQVDFASSAAKTFAVSETGYGGSFSVVASNGNVTASVSGGVLTVTPVSAGLATITVSDSNGQSVSFDVSVTTVTITVH